MKNLALDLWHDLREKRLWPVAILLAVALVAVPVVMLKPVSEPAPKADPAPKAQATSADLPQLKSLAVVADTAAARGGSTLGAFDSKDPFKPPSVVLNAKKDEASNTASAPSSASAAADEGKGAGGSSDGAGGQTGGGGTPPTSQPPSSSPAPRTFTYTADVEFGRSGRERNYRGLRKLEMLPSESNPLLIFLGVDAAGDNAVFLVDSTLKATGEGKCSPSPSSCATVTIGAGSEHEFVDPDGKSYTLLVEQIRPVSVAKASASKRRRKPRASAAVGAGSPNRRFAPPVIADLVTVASSSGRTSSTDHDRR